MILDFCESTHTYTLDGVEIPSVSEVLSSVGISDYSMADMNDLIRAQKRGDHIHYAARLFDYGTLDEGSIVKEWFSYFDAYKKFVHEVKPEWLAIEQSMFSKKYRFATTPDRIGYINGALSDVEIKTTSIITKSVRPQTAAHCICYNENVSFNERIKKRYCLQLRGDGTYKFLSLNNKIDENIFLCALNVHNFKGGSNAIQ